jgi:hypothetical protein
MTAADPFARSRDSTVLPVNRLAPDRHGEMLLADPWWPGKHRFTVDDS